MKIIEAAHDALDAIHEAKYATTQDRAVTCWKKLFGPSFSQTNTFTITNARYLASKIAADLYQIQRFYGEPSDAKINQFVDEVVTLLKDGYFKSIEYGFKKNDKWVLALCYEVSQLNGLDNSPGRVPIGVDISGATWGSYLCKSDKFYALPAAAQEKVLATLPFARVPWSDPKAGLNSTQDKSYSSGNVDIARRIIK